MVPAAFFVLERTVSAVPATRAFGRAALGHGLTSRRRLLQRTASPAGMGDRFLANVADAVSGRTGDEIESLVPEVVGAVLCGVYDVVHARIRAHEAAGVPTWLCSAAPLPFVQRLAASLGMSGGALGTTFQLDARGRYLPQLAGPYCQGDGRNEAVHKLVASRGLDLADCWAYAACIEDLPLLGSVGHAVAVNPDRDLERVAHGAGWEVLRSRPEHRLRSTVAAGAVAGGGAAAAAALVWLTRRPHG